MVQRAATHESQRRNLDLLALKGLLHALIAHQLVQRVVQRPQVRIDLLRHVARQETQALAGLDRRARQDDALHCAALQRIDRAGHRQVGLASAGRSDAEGDVVRGDVFQVGALVDGARAQVGAARRQRNAALGGVERHVARQHQLHGFGLDGPLGKLVQRLQHFERLGGAQLGAVDLELLEAVRNRHLQARLDGADVHVHRPAQISHAGVVGRCEGVAKNQKRVLS